MTGPPVQDNLGSPHNDLSIAIERLIEMVHQETSSLRANDWSGLVDFNRRKSQGLLELRRAITQRDNDAAAGPALAQLMVLQEALFENEIVLQRHLDAARQVSQIISEAATVAESDGTYSSSIAFQPAR